MQNMPEEVAAYCMGVSRLGVTVGEQTLLLTHRMRWELDWREVEAMASALSSMPARYRAT